MPKCETPKVRLELKTTKCLKGPVLNTPDLVASYLREHVGKAAQEWFVALVVAEDMRPTALIEVAAGGMASTMVDPKVLFSSILLAGGTGFAVAHNHPSGSQEPSQADIDLTKQILEGAKLLALRVLDHLIITADGYTSFRARGLIR